MADWVGLFNEYYNTVYTNAPVWMRKRAPMDIIKIYDNLFAPITNEIMPKQPAPRLDGGKVVSVRTPFRIPITSNPQYMSEYADYGERPRKRAIAYRKEMYSASMIHEDGPEWDPLEFTDEWEGGFLEFQRQFLITMAMDAMNRKVEYDNINFIYGDTSTLNRFAPGISTARKKTLQCTSTSDGLTGKGWDDQNDGNILKDIARIKYLAREIGGFEPVKAYIGNLTAYSMEQNEKIKELLKYTTDLTNNVIGARLQNVTFKTVVNQTFKDDSSNSSRPGMPGLGDVRETTWSRDSRTRFMTHVDTDTYEWGLFVPGNIGATYTARVNPEQTDTNSPYIHSWQDPETMIKKTRFQFGYTPFIDEWANVFVVTHMADRS